MNQLSYKVLLLDINHRYLYSNSILCFLFLNFQISSSHENVDGVNLQEETSHKVGLTQKDSQKTCLDKRSNSDSSFPIVNVQSVKTNDRNREKRLFNFRGGITRHYFTVPVVFEQPEKIKLM